MQVKTGSLRRRDMVVSGLTLAFAALVPGAWAASKPADAEKDVSPPEDLMKEHGVLNRCLLVYEEAIRRAEAHEPLTADGFQVPAHVIKTYIEDHHEKDEENFIFPEFEKAKSHVQLVATLREQHDAGRALTKRILDMSSAASFPVANNHDALIAACRTFIRLYRPHAAREDTVLFPALRKILDAEQVKALAKRMEKAGEKSGPPGGFEKALKDVEAIETQLGIHDLATFSPR